MECEVCGGGLDERVEIALEFMPVLIGSTTGQTEVDLVKKAFAYADAFANECEARAKADYEAKQKELEIAHLSEGLNVNLEYLARFKAQKSSVTDMLARLQVRQDKTEDKPEYGAYRVELAKEVERGNAEMSRVDADIARTLKNIETVKARLAELGVPVQEEVVAVTDEVKTEQKG